MTHPVHIEQTDPPRPARDTLPTMYDLPSEDPEEPGLPDEFHYYQPHLLQETFRPPEWEPNRVFAVGDMNLYYDVDHPTWHKRPDWFAVLGVPRFYKERDLRWSYVMWQEGVVPFVVVELLSESTRQDDLGTRRLREIKQPPTKWEVYEQILRVPYYVVYEREAEKFRAFVLEGGSVPRYREKPLPDNRLWINECGLGLGIWHGRYLDWEGPWLRWYAADKVWVPTGEERQAEHAEQQRQRAEQLAAKLRELGVDPDAV